MGRLFAPKQKVEEKPAEPPPPPPPPALSKEEVERIVGGAVAGVAGQLTQVVGSLGQKVEELAARQPQVVVAPPGYGQPVQPHNEDISDQDIDMAVLSGQGAAARIRAMVDRAVDKATARVVNEHVRPLQEYGVNTLGELSRRITAGGMKHYNRFRKEIDDRLNQLTPDVRANPIVIETIYNAVVGLHSDELVREAAESAVRQAQETGNATGQDPVAPTRSGTGRAVTPGTGAGPGTQREGEELPDLNTFLGSNASAGYEALQHKGSGGQDQDAFARSMGYKDWSTYMKQYQELLANETSGNG